MKLEELKNKTKDAVDYLVQSLESGHSEVLKQYLGAMARFHTYSFGNVMLIARQKPDATNVAGIRTWNSLGRGSGGRSGWCAGVAPNDKACLSRTAPPVAPCHPPPASVRPLLRSGLFFPAAAQVKKKTSRKRREREKQ